ncbi:hypothetical protein AMS68_003441 [Peltaster fructicola]|uniref:STB6-like N-terminal domain-containing protein n=1 Tax=Peltaster fructicola TaxID=286661 RepID=A0A6H0XT61_9PEZI|nr:hypothetical protein AMS68_003441 [Peltaster fructicola]
MAADNATTHQRARVPPLQTNFTHRYTASLIDSSQSSKRTGTPATTSQYNTPERTEGSKTDHQRFVLNDPVAFQYLELDKSTRVLARHQELQGYETYVIEQWATSRTHPTFVISSYTGDPSHSIFVDVLSVPSDETSWSPRLRVYFKALNQYNARRESTPLGTLMVSNLSSFPSILTVIPVPGGDIRRCRADFFVNEDLKRLGCSGRVGLTLAAPPANTIAKFHQLYHTSDKNKVYDSVIELVKLCQIALTLFDKLEPEYADGLLCDMTEHAISKWWNDIGAEHYGVEPHDGILGPTTVAALLGLLLGARNRLHSAGAPVSKDPFDIDAMKRGISYFQKQQRLERTRRLDRPTVHHLVKATAKAASHEGWTVPRAVKSTVAELSGRGGEMVSDIVGRRDRAGIAEIETTDYDRFVQLAFGERPRWLWQGKPLKKVKSPEDSRYSNSTLVSSQNDQHSGFSWTGKRADTSYTRASPDAAQIDEPRTPDGGSDGSDDDQRAGLRKRATDLKNEAMSGFGKIKDAVNLRSHHQRLQRGKGESPASPVSPPQPTARQAERDSSPGSPFSHPASPLSPTHESMLDFSLSAHAVSPESQGHGRQAARKRSLSPMESPDVVVSKTSSIQEQEEHDGNDAASDGRTLRIEGSMYEGIDLKQALPEGVETQHDIGPLLRRTISDSQGLAARHHTHEPDFYPRHLSFSLAEDSVLSWQRLHDSSSDSDADLTNRASYAQQALEAEEKKLLRQAINDARLEAVAWTQQQLAALQETVLSSDHDARDLDLAYETRLEHLQSLSSNIDILLKSEREHLDEGGKELETMAARLTYEIDGLKGRMDDVENIVDDFERGVVRVEERVSELENDDVNSRGWRCIVS